MVANSEYHEVINFITSFPKPEEVLAYKAPLSIQKRVEDLVYKKKESWLTDAENSELERFLLLEHMMRMAKKNAKEKLAL